MQSQGPIPDLLINTSGVRVQGSVLSQVRQVVLRRVKFEEARSRSRCRGTELTRGTELLRRVWLSPRKQVAKKAWYRVETKGLERRKRTCEVLRPGW